MIYHRILVHDVVLFSVIIWFTYTMPYDIIRYCTVLYDIALYYTIGTVTAFIDIVAYMHTCMHAHACSWITGLISWFWSWTSSSELLRSGDMLDELWTSIMKQSKWGCTCLVPPILWLWHPIPPITGPPPCACDSRPPPIMGGMERIKGQSLMYLRISVYE